MNGMARLVDEYYSNFLRQFIWAKSAQKLVTSATFANPMLYSLFRKQNYISEFPFYLKN